MPRKSRHAPASYEPKRKNPITLGDDSNIDNDLKPIKIDGKNSLLELSDSELKVRGTIDASTITVDGASVQTGTDAGATELKELSDVTYSSGDLTIDSLDKIVAGALTIDSSGDITLDADGADIVFQDGGTSSKFAKFSNFINSGYFNLYSVADNDDYSNMSCGNNGATSWVTYGSAADITINPAGSIDLRGTGSISLDPDTHTLSKLCLGFTQHTPTFNATDTYVYFYNLGNKATLTLTNNVTDIHFRFPAVSGNFICVLLQDGTGGRTISNFKTQDASGNAGDDGGGTPGSIRWAGGTAPSNTETANKADIASFYWDADNEIAYGTYSYNF